MVIGHTVIIPTGSIYSHQIPTMRCPSRLWLCSMALLSTANVSAVTTSPDTCVIQAWVRAPDLDPGEIIPGQVRIQTKGFCSPISEYSLILRFKERMRVKILKSGAALPEKPRGSFFNLMGDLYEQSRVPKNPSWDAYAQKLNDPALWAIAEQERVAFETRYKLFNGPTPQSEIRSMHDFALLVPTTNYPPSGVDFMPSLMTGGSEIAGNNENVYLYTVEVKFVNGTVIEIPAGRSSFNVVGPNSEGNDTAEAVTFTANFKEISRTGPIQPWTPLNISFDVDVTFPYGRRLEQGSTLNLTFTISGELQVNPDIDQANYSIMLGRPSLDLLPTSTYCSMETLFPGMNVSVDIPSSHLSRSQLSPTSDDSERSQKCDRPYLGAAIRKPYWNKITSVSYEIPKIAFPSFDMYYQSIEAEIVIVLNLQYVQTPDPLLANEDYAWIPTVPVIPRLEISRYFGNSRTAIPVTIYPRARKHYQVTHYLSPEARQPIFVDPSKGSELSKLSVRKRDFLAPRSEPVINKDSVDGDGKVVRRYDPRSTLYYVGDTWQRKVLDDLK